MGGVKPPEPLRSRGGGYPDLSGPTTKKTTFLCVSSLSWSTCKNYSDFVCLFEELRDFVDNKILKRVRTDNVMQYDF